MRFRRDNSGAFAIFTALTLPVLIGVVGLATEGGLWLYQHQQMQGAADSAAVSAATAYSYGDNKALAAQGKGIAATYGFIDGQGGVAVTVSMPPASGTHQTTPGAVEVDISGPQQPLFSALWLSHSITIGARAVAVGNTGTGCVVALNGSASGALTAQGSTAVNLSNCSLYDNSTSSSALVAGGSATVSAQAAYVVGGVSGSSSITTTNGIVTGASSLSDPYSGVAAPSYSNCDYSNTVSINSSNKGSTLSPGVYCGGIKVNSSANVTLSAGVYIIAGGSLTVSGSATVQGTGVTLVFLQGSNGATINGGAVVNLTAPTSGTYAGIVLYERGAATGTSFKLTGGSTQVFGGAIDLPDAAVTFAGGSGSSNSCTQLIANTVTFTGNSNFAINCSGYGTKPLGATAMLVE